MRLKALISSSSKGEEMALRFLASCFLGIGKVSSFSALKSSRSGDGVSISLKSVTRWNQIPHFVLLWY
jgi:hypothetical protein